MVLATHAITGAALATLVPGRPVTAFCLGFISHFILDTIPHWDYKLASSKENKEHPLDSNIEVGASLGPDLSKIAFDACLGLFLVIVFLSPPTLTDALTLLAGALGGILPDPLQFAYYRLRREPLISLQKFHVFVHAKTRLAGYPLPGATLQALFVILIVFITTLIR